MKKLMYVPLFPNNTLVRENKSNVESSYSFFDTVASDLFLQLSNQLIVEIKKNFILEYCLSVAIAEAYNADELIFPVRSDYIDKQTYNPSAFFKLLKMLTQTGTLKKIKVTFPNYEEFCDEFEIDSSCLEKRLTDSNVVSVLNIFSGGLDCTVVSAILEKQQIPQHYIFYDYGQNNIREEKLCVEEQRSSREISLKAITFDNELKNFYEYINFSTGLLSNKKITLENKKDEYVPFRNSLFIAYALNVAIYQKNSHIVTGSHMDDVNSPDNNYLYYNIWNNLLRITKPYNFLTVLPILFNVGGKKEVVKLGNDLKIDFNQTWTCHNKSLSDGNFIPCGECNDCKVREEAFRSNGLIDPMSSIEPTEDIVNIESKSLATVISLMNQINKKDNVDFTDNTKSLLDYGFDSLMSIHLITMLEDVWDIELDGDYLIDFNNKTPREISRLVDEVITINE